MKTTRLMVILVLIAGGGNIVAAQNEERRVEKRVMVTGSAAAVASIPAQPAREPVTFLGVAVAPTGPVLAAQLRLPEGQGLVVNVVETESPAGKAGLQQHDVLTKLDDQILIDPRQLSVLVRNRKAGETVGLTYVRAGAEARTTATLATHVPGPEPFLHWIGGEPADVLFRTENFSPAAGFPVPLQNGPHVEHFQMRVLGPGERSAGGGPGHDRVMIFRPQAGVVFSDEAGSLEMQMDEHGQKLTAKNAKGEIVFSGPVTTPEERSALPEDLRERLEKFEALDVFDAPASAPPDAVHFAPGKRVDLSPSVL